MKKKPAGLEDRQWGQHQMVVCLECQRTDVDVIAWMVESYEKLQKPDTECQSVLLEDNLLSRTVHSMGSLSSFKRRRRLVRMKITDVFEHVLCKGKHSSNALHASLTQYL